MPEVIATFSAADGWYERADPLAQTTNSPLGELSKKGFDFAERHLNRVKVRRVLRQIQHHCTGCFDRHSAVTAKLTDGRSIMMHFSHRVAYMLSGLAGRITQHPSCPACGDSGSSIRDRKWFHTLVECQTCLLLYRFPMESPRAMSDFYDVGYSEPGLTTEFPDDKQLSELLENGFKGSEKDFTYHASILSALKVPVNGRILDFGANWGYASWQFARAGFDVKSFEISKP